MRSAIGNFSTISGSSNTAAFAAGLPSPSMYAVWLSSLVMQFTASTASSGWSLKAPMPMLMPPSGGAALGALVDVRDPRPADVVGHGLVERSVLDPRRTAP